MVDLKKELHIRGLSKSGSKKALIDRLSHYLKSVECKEEKIMPGCKVVEKSLVTGESIPAPDASKKIHQSESSWMVVDQEIHEKVDQSDLSIRLSRSRKQRDCAGMSKSSETVDSNMIVKCNLLQFSESISRDVEKIHKDINDKCLNQPLTMLQRCLKSREMTTRCYTQVQ